VLSRPKQRVVRAIILSWKSVVLLLLFSFNIFLSGQESDVHITPLKKPPVTAAPDAATTNTAPVTVAAEQSGLRIREKPIKIDVDLVLVNVTVTDTLNRLVTGLEKENFNVVEANLLQEIKHFASEDAPVSIGVIFDISGSMSNKIEKSKQAVVEFFKTANPQDEFFVITFSDKPTLLTDFTSSVEELQTKLTYVVPRGRTALLDAVYLGINKMRQASHSKKALLIISDGGDNHSRYTDGEIRNIVREADVQIYAIGIFDAGGGSTTEEVHGPYLLSELTDPTGGRTFTISDVSELADVSSKIGVELRNQYVIGYKPSNTEHDGRWRKIKVKLIPPKGLPPLFVHAKSGYYAPQP